MATPLEQEAQALGFPATLFGYGPNESKYWREPGLPWVPSPDSVEYMLTPDRRGGPTLWHMLTFDDNSMAPRFPKGCVVNISPVFFHAELEIGRVYAYRSGAGATERWSSGRLTSIGDGCLQLTRDNDPTPALWLLRVDTLEALWDVYEVTHYALYPGLL